MKVSWERLTDLKFLMHNKSGAIGRYVAISKEAQEVKVRVDGKMRTWKIGKAKEVPGYYFREVVEILSREWLCKPGVIRKRIIAMGMCTPCERCAGTGNFSFCQAYGRTCFGCCGLGSSIQGEWPKTLLDEARQKMMDGELKEYFKKVNPDEKMFKNYIKRIKEYASTKETK